MQQTEEVLPSEGFVRLKTILHVIPVGKTTWWEGVLRGRFPQPVKLGSRITAWPVQEIRDLIAQITVDTRTTVVRDGIRVTRNTSPVRRNGSGEAQTTHGADEVSDQTVGAGEGDAHGQK